MKIYVDADACPTVIKDILYRVSQRTGLEVILVANQPLSIPRIPTVRSIQVSQGFDVADNHIVELVEDTNSNIWPVIGSLSFKQFRANLWRIWILCACYE
ncbi:MAG TPA: hypothetical protein EYQ22_05455 [Gammaproteobacteria bacterium]|nr:hypothetical protein [Gammaproteobacteria bacterium]